MSKDKSTIYGRLLVLESQGYIYKAYDSSYRLPPRPAVYALTKQGVRFLRKERPDLAESALRYLSKTSSADLQAVDHSLKLFKLCLQLRKQYPDTFDILAKSEMANFKAFIRPLPDLYLRRRNKWSKRPNYLVEVIEADAYTYKLNKRLNKHMDYEDEHGEEYGSKGYSTPLFVCGNNNTEKRIQEMAWDKYGLTIYTTTQERWESGNTKIWLHEYSYEDDEPMVFISL